MRYLFVTGGGSATVFAVAPLASAARSAGHEVLVAVPREDVDAVVALGLPGVAVCELSLLDAMFRDRSGALLPHPSDPTTGVQFAARGFARLAAAGHVALTELAKAWRPDIVVGGAQSHGAALVARQLSLPFVRHAWDVHEQCDTDLTAASDELAPELAALGLDDLPVSDLFITTTPPSVRPAGAEPAQTMRWTPGNRQVPLEPWMYTRPGRPRVCITSGSRAHLVPALLGVPFLGELVANPALAHCEVVVATDEAVAAELRSVRPDVLAGWIPLEAVAPTCDLIVHHGGGVTAMNALNAGVPQLTLPVLPISLAPMRRLDEAGAAITLDSSRVSPDEIGRACTALLTDPSHLAAARVLQAEIAHQPTPADVVRAVLDQLT